MKKEKLKESTRRPYFRRLRFFSLLSLFGKNMDDWPIVNNPPVVEMLGKSIFFNFVRIPSLLLTYPADNSIYTLVFVLPMFLMYMFFLPFIMLELLIYAIVTIGHFCFVRTFFKNIYSKESYYIELKTCVLHIFYFFVSVFSYIGLYNYIGSTNINMLYVLVLIFFLYPYMSAFFLSFKISPFKRRYEIIDINSLTESLDKIYNADNYYSSSASDKKLIETYRFVIDLIKDYITIQRLLASEEINNIFTDIDLLFDLLDQRANYERIEDINLFKARLLSYVDDKEKFLPYKNELLIKSRIIYNIDNEVIIDKIIKEIGIKKTREYVDDLTDFVNKHMSIQCADVYNKLLFIIKTKLLQS